MFERYTEKARRVIFYARYEASAFGSPLIEPEFLLLGILREEPYAVTRWLGGENVITLFGLKIAKISGTTDDKWTERSNSRATGNDSTSISSRSIRQTHHPI
jgi:hypothetical protein